MTSRAACLALGSHLD